VRIRRARPDDAAAVAAIYNQGIAARSATFETELRTAEDRRRVIEAQGERWPVLVAEDAGTVMGWASLSEHSPRACYRGIAECSVYVSDRHQGHGVGKALIAALVAEAARLGYWKLVSRAFLFNTASRAMCVRAGFREVGVYERHARLDGEWLDVVIVERLIPENQR
jgi:phosphinothricin acetyltransferase